MKKILLVAGMLMALTACQKDEGIVSDTATTSSFTVTIPQGETPTRAVTDAFGTGTSANRCILEIYHGDRLYDRIEKGVTAKTVTFDNLRLVAQQTYDFVFWADCADGSEGNFTDRHYNTQSLKAISNRGNFEGNSDERDAFFAKETFEVTGAFSKPVTLTRPFGLLVVKTNDLNEIKDEALKPTGYTVAFKGLPTTFNALTDEVSGPADVTYTAGELAKDDGTISMDFLWATNAEAALSDFSMTFLNNGTTICTNDAFTNIPIRRNYRTNVSGNLLTKQGTINVTIDPEFQGDIPRDIDQVKDIAAANEAFAAGKTNVIVTDVPTDDATLILPSTEAPVSATLPALTTKLKVQYSGAAGAKQPVTFHLTTSSSATVEIKAPNSTVTLSGAQYADVTATTAANTLIVSEETTIEQLTVKSGNVEVYGSVRTIVSKPAGTIFTLYASTVEQLRDFASGVKAGTNVYNKVILAADIDFKGAVYTIEKASGLEFDGQGHKLSNYKVENTQTAGLICDAISVTVRNLTVEGATVRALDDGSGNAYAGALVGRSYGTIVFDNCQTVNSTVEGINKVGGMIGFVAENRLEATDCKVIGCTISNIDITEESGQTGGFAGYLGSLYSSTCSFTNCSVEDTEINVYMNRNDRTISKFIGCFQGDQATDIVSIDNCSVKDVTLNGMNEMARSFVSTYGDLLGGQRNGNGTVKITNSDTDIYISTKEQLFTLASMVNAGEAFAQKKVKLANDIDLKNESWTPIGNGSRSGSIPTGNQFKGTFDGKGQTISNLNINTTKGTDFAVGLFGVVNGGTIENLKLQEVAVDVPTSEMAAAAVGMLTGGGAVSGVEILSGHVTAKRGNGAIVGRMIKGGTISGCKNYAKITGTGANVGGIVGAAYYTAESQTMTIENCENHGQVTGTAGVVGGIVGLSAADVSNCVNEEAVTGAGNDVAGIVAEQQNAGSVKNCTNNGDVHNNNTASYGTAGIVGWIRYNGAEQDYPVKNVIEVTGNTNHGAVSGGNDAGGIVGTVYNLGKVNDNKNFAPSLQAATFAAGIVGNAQFTETAVGMTEPNSVEVKNNVSTTPKESITGNCTDLYVYINNQEFVTAGNNRNSE